MPSIALIATFFISFFVPIFIWLILKPLLKTNRINRVLTTELTAFQQDTLLFENSLQAIPTLEEDANTPHLKLGNEMAKKQLIVVLSFYCGACAKTLKDLIALSEMQEIGITIKLVAKNEASKAMAIYLHQIQMLSGNQAAIKVLTAWYELKDFANLKSAFPVPASTFNADTKQGFSNFFETGKTWFEKIKLTHTPFFIFNHQKIPIKYTFSDIKYHLRRM